MLRIVAALFVVFAHAFELTGRVAPGDAVLERVNLNWGQVGVVIFFSVSGFLVTRSWTLDPSPRDFATKRILRIWPGLVVMLVLLAFVLGPIVSDVSIAGYFASGKPVGFVMHNTVMAPIENRLPGVFVRNPAGGVNGSLWTLPYEVLAYCGVLVAGVLGVFRRRYLFVIGFVGLAVLFRTGVENHVPDTFRTQFNGMNAYLLIRLAVPFAAGGACWLFRDRIVLRPMGAGIGVAALIAAVALRLPLLAYVVLPYLAVYAGTRPWTVGRRLHRLGDPSYGMYIYAFPIQQLLISTSWIGPKPWPVFVAAATLSAVAGYASWHLIERPAMRLRHRKTSAQFA